MKRLYILAVWQWKGNTNKKGPCGPFVTEVWTSDDTRFRALLLHARGRKV